MLKVDELKRLVKAQPHNPHHHINLYIWLRRMGLKTEAQLYWPQFVRDKSIPRPTRKFIFENCEDAYWSEVEKHLLSCPTPHPVFFTAFHTSPGYYPWLLSLRLFKGWKSIPKPSYLYRRLYRLKLPEGWALIRGGILIRYSKREVDFALSKIL